MELDGNPSPKQKWSAEDKNQFREDLLRRIRKLAPKKSANFSGLICPIDIDFRAGGPVERLNGADFFGSQFLGVTSFSRVGFGENTNFGRCKFTSANFRECTFHYGADFSGSSFDPEPLVVAARGLFSVLRGWFRSGVSTVHWEAAPLSMNPVADFGFVRFGGPMSFVEATFVGPADFSSTSFSGVSSFSLSAFHESVNFDDSDFSSACEFSGASFQGDVPTFNGEKLHDGVDFTGAEFLSFSMPGDEAGYRFLKRTMETRRDRKEQVRFFAYELRARRSRLRPLSAEWFFSASYGLFADYGQSISRPISTFFVVLLGASAGYYFVSQGEVVVANGGAGWIIQTVFEFAIQQYVRPFAIWASGYSSHIEWVEPNLGVLRWLALVQSVLGIGALTLFVLAVRRKFRLE